MIAKSRRCSVPDAADENDRRFVNGCSSSGSPATQPGVTACRVLTLPAHSKLHDVCSPRNKPLDMSQNQATGPLVECTQSTRWSSSHDTLLTMPGWWGVVGPGSSGVVSRNASKCQCEAKCQTCTVLVTRPCGMRMSEQYWSIVSCSIAVLLAWLT